MRIYAVHNDAYNWHENVTATQSVMFHGEAIVPKNRHGYASHTNDDSDISPMEIAINGYDTPPVFMPEWSSSLVVREDIMTPLREIAQRVVFIPVRFKKVYYFPWDKNSDDLDLSFAIQSSRRTAAVKYLHDYFNNDDISHSTIAPYYEAVCFNHYAVCRNDRTCNQFFTRSYNTKPLERDLLPVSHAMFCEHSMTTASYPIVRDDAYGILERHLQSKYFGIKCYDIDVN